jgi:urease accessory protein
VSLAAAAAGPIGGDRFRIEVDVGPGSTLVLAQVGHTLLLPGRDGAESRTDMRIRVADGATFIWLAEPLIAAHGCEHVNDVEVRLGLGSTILVREETLLGRHGEPSGHVRHNVRVDAIDGPLYRHQLELGTRTALSPVVAGRHRAIGSVLVRDPARDGPPGDAGLPGDTVLMSLAAGGILVSGVAEDSLALRAQLDAGLERLGPPWSPIGRSCQRGQPRTGRGLP